LSYATGTDPTLTELITAGFIPAKFSKDVIMHTKSNLVVADSVNTTFRDDLVYGYTVTIPLFSEASTAEITPGTAITPSDSAGTPATLTVNKWYGVAHEISEMAKIQSFADYFGKCAQSQAYSISKKVDTDLGALFSALSSSSVYGSDGQEFTDDIILAIVQVLDEADVPEPRVVIGDPSTRIDILKTDKFVRNDYVRNPVVPTGKIGDIYNMQVKITNNLTAATTGNYGVVMHEDAIGLVMQKSPYSQVITEDKLHHTIVQTKVIYGLGELRDTFGKAFYTHKS
jgi:hypothetical protein